MEYLFPILKYLFFGVFGAISLLFVLALLFGKRVITKWDFEAGFRDDKGKEIGEFEIKMSRVEKNEPEFSQKTSFRLRHPALTRHSTVQVKLGEAVVLEGLVEKDGSVRLGNDHVRTLLAEPKVGQRCSVECGGTVLVAADLELD